MIKAGIKEKWEMEEVKNIEREGGETFMEEGGREVWFIMQDPVFIAR